MGWLERHVTLHSHDSPREELANGMTHLVGAVLAVVGTVLLLLKTAPTATRVAYAVFGVSMMLLFSASTAYHLSPMGSRVKRLFRLADHMSIYLLIAGTYTPVMIVIGQPWAYMTLAAVWFLAISGMALKVVLWDRFRVWQVLFFLAMGWLAVIRIGTIVETVPTPFLYLLLTGGVVYSLGTIVYALKRLPYHHAVWHLFVLGGAASFFWGVYRYLTVDLA